MFDNVDYNSIVLAKIARRKDPQAFATFLYHLIKQKEGKCALLEDIQEGSKKTQELLKNQFEWSPFEILTCLKLLNQYTKYCKKRKKKD
jgi:hypothetical protein